MRFDVKNRLFIECFESFIEDYFKCHLFIINTKEGVINLAPRVVSFDGWLLKCQLKAKMRGNHIFRCYNHLYLTLMTPGSDVKAWLCYMVQSNSCPYSRNEVFQFWVERYVLPSTYQNLTLVIWWLLWFWLSC